MSPAKHFRCGHVPCRCLVTADEKYCGQACKKMGADEVETACP